MEAILTPIRWRRGRDDREGVSRVRAKIEGLAVFARRDMPAKLAGRRLVRVPVVRERRKRLVHGTCVSSCSASAAPPRGRHQLSVSDARRRQIEWGAVLTDNHRRAAPYACGVDGIVAEEGSCHELEEW